MKKLHACQKLNADRTERAVKRALKPKPAKKYFTKKDIQMLQLKQLKKDQP
jgi:hypothetical protein